MIKLMFIGPDERAHEVCAEIGSSVMQAARDGMVPGIEAACGGNCVCATCHAYIDSRWTEALPSPDETEAGMLACTLDPRPNSRLTCQLIVTPALEGMILRVADSQH